MSKKQAAAPFLGIVLLFGIVLSGCSSNMEAVKDPEQLYRSSCMSCHAGDFDGLSGPSLIEVGDTYTSEEIVDIIQNGTGRMGAVRGLDEEQAIILADWLINETATVVE